MHFLQWVAPRLIASFLDIWMQFFVHLIADVQPNSWYFSVLVLNTTKSECLSFDGCKFVWWAYTFTEPKKRIVTKAMHLMNFVKKVIVHFGKNLLVFIIEKTRKISKPGRCGCGVWAPARRGSGRPGWVGCIEKRPLLRVGVLKKGRGWSEGEASPSHTTIISSRVCGTLASCTLRIFRSRACPWGLPR